MSALTPAALDAVSPSEVQMPTKDQLRVRLAIRDADDVSTLIENGKRINRSRTEDLRDHVRWLAAQVEALTAERDEARPWMWFYGMGLDLGEIAERTGKSIYAYSPWLTAPITRVALECNAAAHTKVEAAEARALAADQARATAEAALGEVARDIATYITLSDEISRRVANGGDPGEDAYTQCDEMHAKLRMFAFRRARAALEQKPPAAKVDFGPLGGRGPQP